MKGFLNDGKRKRTIGNSRSSKRRSSRDVNIVLDHLIPWHLVCRNKFMEPDVYLPFYHEADDDTEPVRIHFHLGTMVFRMLYREMVHIYMDMRDEEEVKELCRFRIEETAEKSFQLKVRSQVGKELIACMYAAGCVFQDHQQVSQFAVLAEYLGCFTHTLRRLDTVGLYPPRPPTYKNYICHFYTSVRSLRNPDKIRCGLHFNEAMSYYFELEFDTDAGNHDTFIGTSIGTSLLRDSESGFFSGESESDGVIVSEKYKQSRHRVYKVYKPAPAPISPEQRGEEVMHVCLYFLDLTFACQRPVHSTMFSELRMSLQILCGGRSDSEAVINKLDSCESKYITWTLSEGTPSFFFDVGSKHSFITVGTGCNNHVLLGFLRNLQQLDGEKKFCKGIAMRMQLPDKGVVRRMLGAVKVVGADPMYHTYYIIQPSLDSMFRVIEKLLDKSLQLEPHPDFHVIEVPDSF